MKKSIRATLVSAAVLLAALGFAPAQAEEYDCSLAGGSAENPHLVDRTNDWGGQLGNGGFGAGDVWREGTDIVAAWMDRDASGTYANIQLADFAGTEINGGYQFEWALTVDDVITEYYVLATIGRPNTAGPNATYTYGHSTVDPTTGTGQLNEDGNTTGSLNPETNVIRIKLHRSQVRATGVYEAIKAETSFLVGAGVGFYVLADSTDMDPCGEVTI